MDIVLCPNCLTWVRLTGERCPECEDRLDLSEPDPSTEMLHRRLGAVQCELGQIIVSRRHLPDVGTLYATDRGLLFLPHRIGESGQIVMQRPASRSLLWSVAGLIWAPLFIFSLIPKRPEPTLQTYTHFIPQVLDEQEWESLPDLLMESPGAWFVDRSAIQSLTGGRFGWKLRRIGANGIRFRPDSPDDFRSRLNDLMERPQWNYDLIEH